MGRSFLSCPECERLWRDFGYATGVYLNVLAKKNNGKIDLGSLQERRERLRAAIHRHERELHDAALVEYVVA